MALSGRERFMQRAAAVTSPRDDVRRYVLEANDDRTSAEVVQILASLLNDGLHPEPAYRLPVPTLLLVGSDDPTLFERFDGGLGNDTIDGGAGGARVDYANNAATAGVTVVLTTHYLEEAEQLCDRIAIINHGQVVANEPTRDLLGRAQEKVVAVTVDRDLTEAPAAICFDKVVLMPPRTLEITYAKDRVNAGEVLAAVQANGLGIVDVSTREADLEDVFLSLTRTAG